jgi:hypothetical protein
MPVLTEETVEGARFEKNGQVFETLFGPWAMGIPGETTSCPAGADPVCNAIGRKGIKIAGKVSLSRTAAKNFSRSIETRATVAAASFRNSALIDTQKAWHTIRVMRREGRKSEILPDAGMQSVQMRFDLIEAGTNTISTQIKGRANQIGYFFAAETLCHAKLPTSSLSVLNPHTRQKQEILQAILCVRQGLPYSQRL